MFVVHLAKGHVNFCHHLLPVSLSSIIYQVLFTFHSFHLKRMRQIKPNLDGIVLVCMTLISFLSLTDINSEVVRILYSKTTAIIWQFVWMWTISVIWKWWKKKPTDHSGLDNNSSLIVLEMSVWFQLVKIVYYLFDETCEKKPLKFTFNNLIKFNFFFRL